LGPWQYCTVTCPGSQGEFVFFRLHGFYSIVANFGDFSEIFWAKKQSKPTVSILQNIKRNLQSVSLELADHFAFTTRVHWSVGEEGGVNDLGVKALCWWGWKSF